MTRSGLSRAPDGGLDLPELAERLGFTDEVDRRLFVAGRQMVIDYTRTAAMNAEKEKGTTPREAELIRHGIPPEQAAEMARWPASWLLPLFH